MKYLKKAVHTAVSCKGVADIASLIGRTRHPSLAVYRLIKDIVCDIRFLSVVGNGDFWKKYAVYRIVKFIESLDSEDWKDDRQLTGKKEDFLNEWFLQFVFPVSSERQKELERKMEESSHQGGDRAGGMECWENGRLQSVEDCIATSFGRMKALPAKILPYEKGGYNRSAGEEKQTEVKYLQSLDSTLVDLAKRIGRTGMGGGSGRFRHSSRSDISGIDLGDDLNSLLPSEISLLGDTLTEDVFYKRYVEKKLQVFSSASVGREGICNKGPIYMCIDTSGSMSGEPEDTAKSLALAIAILAQREKRSLCIVNYSHTVSFFVLRNLRKQKRMLLNFLSRSYNGGNDEDLLFRFLFEDLPASLQYKEFKSEFRTADLLVISDFEWMEMTDEVRRLIKKVRHGGMKFYALKVNGRDYSQMDGTLISCGEAFFKDCDYRFRYLSGKCLEEVTGK